MKKKQGTKAPRVEQNLKFMLLYFIYFSFMQMLGLVYLGFLHPCGNHPFDIRATFSIGCGFSLHSLSLPIFSTQHALAKEKGLGILCPLLIFPQFGSFCSIPFEDNNNHNNIPSHPVLLSFSCHVFPFNNSSLLQIMLLILRN